MPEYTRDMVINYVNHMAYYINSHDGGTLEAALVHIFETCVSDIQNERFSKTRVWCKAMVVWELYQEIYG